MVLGISVRFDTPVSLLPDWQLHNNVNTSTNKIEFFKAMNLDLQYGK